MRSSSWYWGLLAIFNMEQVSTFMSAKRSPNFLFISNSVFPHMKIGGVYSTTGFVSNDHGVTQDSGNSGD